MFADSISSIHPLRSKANIALVPNIPPAKSNGWVTGMEPGSLLAFPLPPSQPLPQPADHTYQSSLEDMNQQAPPRTTQHRPARKRGPKPAAAPFQTPEMDRRCRQRLDDGLRHIREYVKLQGIARGSVPQPDKEVKKLQAIQKVMSDQSWLAYLQEHVWQDQRKSVGMDTDLANAPASIGQGTADAVDAALPAFLKHEIRVKIARDKQSKATPAYFTNAHSPVQTDAALHSHQTIPGASHGQPSYEPAGRMQNSCTPKIVGNGQQEEPYPTPNASSSLQPPEMLNGAPNPAGGALLGQLAPATPSVVRQHVPNQRPKVGSTNSNSITGALNTSLEPPRPSLSPNAQDMLNGWEQCFFEPRLRGVTDPARLQEIGLERVYFRDCFHQGIEEQGEIGFLQSVCKLLGAAQQRNMQVLAPQGTGTKRGAPDEDDGKNDRAAKRSRQH
jgi:hypothetical protein